MNYRARLISSHSAEDQPDWPPRAAGYIRFVLGKLRKQEAAMLPLLRDCRAMRAQVGRPPRSNAGHQKLKTLLRLEKSLLSRMSDSDDALEKARRTWMKLDMRAPELAEPLKNEVGAAVSNLREAIRVQNERVQELEQYLPGQKKNRPKSKKKKSKRFVDGRKRKDRRENQARAFGG